MPDRQRLVFGFGYKLMDVEVVAHWRTDPIVDNLVEEFYQHLMVCYKARGQTAEVAKTYQSCRSVLSAHFTIAPSPETEAIYRHLIRKD